MILHPKLIKSTYFLLQSTGSFFHTRKSITLGSLIGISGIIEQSTRGRISEPISNKKNYKTKTWFPSLCSKLSTDVVSTNNAPSLVYFLEAERRATPSKFRRNPSLVAYGPDNFSHACFDRDSLYVTPPRSSYWGRLVWLEKLK